eukprot:5019728-Pleurochrysis_carterae.AAC.2
MSGTLGGYLQCSVEPIALVASQVTCTAEQQQLVTHRRGASRGLVPQRTWNGPNRWNRPNTRRRSHHWAILFFLLHAWPSYWLWCSLQAIETRVHGKR